MEDKRWVDTRFPGVLRFSNFIAEADNVFTPQFIQAVSFLQMRPVLGRAALRSYVWLFLGPVSFLV